MLADFCLLVLILWCIQSPFGSYGPKEIAKINKKVFWDTQVHRRFYQNNRSDEIIFVFPISLKLLSSYSSNCVAIAKVSNCGLGVSDLESCSWCIFKIYQIFKYGFNPLNPENIATHY